MTTENAAMAAPSSDAWPALSLADWRETYTTLHMMTQIVGKVRLARAPMINHWWQVALYVTARGLTTSSMPYDARRFQIDFDFIDHVLRIEVSDGGESVIPLRSRPIAHFYADVMTALEELGVPVSIWPQPVEVEGARFDEDFGNTVYEPEQANRFWRVLSQADRALAEFRSRFLGKSSPVHFFWGSFDLAVTRFSGRPAPERSGAAPNLGDWVMREAYSRECSSCGFWPGGGVIDEPAFYAYQYPEPAGYRDYPVRPQQALYNTDMGEYVLPYEAVRTSSDPLGAILEFLQTTYEAGAIAAGWDREALERDR